MVLYVSFWLQDACHASLNLFWFWHFTSGDLARKANVRLSRRENRRFKFGRFVRDAEGSGVSDGDILLPNTASSPDWREGRIK